jgi:hypothetical protein
VTARHGSGRAREARGPFAACAPALLAALLGALLSAGGADAQTSTIRITGIEPSRTDSTLTCTLLTSGLPDGPSRETLSSGLPSSLAFTLTLLDAGGRERAITAAEVRIEPDPWEHTFVVRQPAGSTRVAGLDELAAALRRIGPLTLASTRGLDPRAGFRIRARLVVHALAPAEADRAHALFMGDLSANGAERREVSAGLGSLLRFFLGRTPAAAWSAEATSAPFEARTLGRAP